MFWDAFGMANHNLDLPVGPALKTTMATLTELLTDESKVEVVTSDCVRMIEEEVAAKRGVSGFAIKAGFKAVGKVLSLIHI